ncbi:MAG TPA: hypothetical protein VGX69_02965 [Solirubrobacteraceae bacterium]|jgi:hypothetical protein|nr:hypothetical protein [Solirubrobacteraceae bacterium]
MSVVREPADVDHSAFAPASRIALVARPRLRLFAPSLLAVIALVIWRLSLLHVNVSNLGDYGLPPALPIAWYVALFISVAGAATAIATRGTSGLIMVGYVIVVAVILFGTVPVLSAQPHYAWVYKHIGVVRYLEAHGKVNINIDIYNRWPGFFALAAVFSSVAGSTNPEIYAGWAELVFILLDAVLVMAAVKAITREMRIAAGAGLLFVVTNWVGQDYYSPQAFASVLGLALIVLLLRQMRVKMSSHSTRLTRLIERIGRVPQLSVQIDDATRWPRWAALTTILSLDAVTVVSHQLTPYMLLVSVALLMLAGVVRPWWILVAMAVMTGAYLGANFQFIQQHYGIFTSIDPFNNAQGQGATLARAPSAGKLFNTYVELLFLVVLTLGSLCAVVRLLRLGLMMRALPFVVLALAPFFILFGQNYGGEASLRIILFSSPWCAALISWGLATVVRQRVRWALTMLVAVAFTALFVPSFLGEEELNIFSPAEVRGSEWFYYHARPGTVLVLAAPGFPYRYGATYPEFLGPEGDANPNLLTEPAFEGRQLGTAEVQNVAARIREYAKHGYVAFTKVETAYAEVFRITPPGALGHLEAAVARSTEFRLWYRNQDMRVYELVERPMAIRNPAAAGGRKLYGVPTVQLVQQVGFISFVRGESYVGVQETGNRSVAGPVPPRAVRRAHHPRR